MASSGAKPTSHCDSAGAHEAGAAWLRDGHRHRLQLECVRWRARRCSLGPWWLGNQQVWIRSDSVSPSSCNSSPAQGVPCVVKGAARLSAIAGRKAMVGCALLALTLVSCTSASVSTSPASATSSAATSSVSTLAPTPTPSPPTASGFRPLALTFVSATDGWVIGPGACAMSCVWIYHTTDGGRDLGEKRRSRR
jgi:hypothetical protein